MKLGKSMLVPANVTTLVQIITMTAAGHTHSFQFGNRGAIVLMVMLGYRTETVSVSELQCSKLYEPSVGSYIHRMRKIYFDE